jgi:hypothetical protein
MLNGKYTINIDELRAFCVYQSSDNSLLSPESRSEEEENTFNENHPTIIWLWRLFREFSEGEVRGFLYFFTGVIVIMLKYK